MLQKYLPFFFFYFFPKHLPGKSSSGLGQWCDHSPRFCSTVQINSPARDLISSPGNSMEWQGRELVLLWGSHWHPSVLSDGVVTAGRWVTADWKCVSVPSLCCV